MISHGGSRIVRPLAKLSGAVATMCVMVACGGGSVAGPTPIPPSGRVASPPPRLARSRILAFGDSLTLGVTSLPVIGRLGAGIATSYPFRLQALLTERYPAQTLLVENAGKAGETAADGLVRLPTVLRAIEPDVVILLHGVNDITFEGVRGVARNMAFLSAMVRAAKATGATVVLCTQLPQRPGGFRAADPVALTAFNEALRVLASSERVLLLDFAADFGGVALIGQDGLHPIEAGYVRMAEMVFATLREEFEQLPPLH